LKSPAAISEQGDRCEKDCNRACRIVAPGVDFAEPACKSQCEFEKQVCRRTSIEIGKILPPSSKEQFEKVATQFCSAAFETITKAIMVSSCFASPAGSQAKIDVAKSLLIKNNILSSDDFEAVTIRFCGIHAEGITPDRDTIYLNDSYLRKDDIQVAALLAH